MRGLGIHLNFSLHPDDDGDKVTTRDAHCGHHNEHLKTHKRNEGFSYNNARNKMSTNWTDQTRWLIHI